LYKAIKSAMAPVEGQLTAFEEVLYASRAVKVNGGRKIPNMFVEVLAVAVTSNAQGVYERRLLVDAITAGFIKPAENSTTSSNFILYQNQGSYMIAHHLQSDFYEGELGRVELEAVPFENSADIVLEVVPRLRLHKLMVSVHRVEVRPFQAGVKKTGSAIVLSWFWGRVMIFCSPQTSQFRKKIVGMTSWFASSAGV
jgi:hypothetical protein